MSDVIKGVVIYSHPGTIDHNVIGLHAYYYTTEDTKSKIKYPKQQIATTLGYLDKQTYSTIIDHPEHKDVYQVYPTKYFDRYARVSTPLETPEEVAIHTLLSPLMYMDPSNLARPTFDETDKHSRLNKITIRHGDGILRRSYTKYKQFYDSGKWDVTGDEIKHRGLWKQLFTIVADYKNKGIDIDVRYIKNHGDSIGLEVATITANSYKQGVDDSLYNYLPYTYWTYNTPNNPLLAHKYCYFSKGDRKDKSDRYMYFLSDPEKLEHTPCRHTAPCMFGLVYLNKQAPEIEIVKDKVQYSPWESNYLISLNLTTLRRPDIYLYILRHGPDALHPYINSMGIVDLKFNDTQLIAHEVFPPALSYKVGTVYELLSSTLEKIHKQDVALHIQDVTDVLYDKTTNDKGVTKTSFKKELGVGTKTIEVTAEVTKLGFKEDRSLKVMLTNDLIERNALKRLEKFNPTIYLVLEKVSEYSFIYTTHVVCDLGEALYSGFYSNTYYCS